MNSNFIKQIVEEHIKLQNNLNNIIDNNWLINRSINDFKRAIWLECAEAVESLPWKWWKKQTININNFKIELIDIYHFLLSWIILKKDNNIKDNLYRVVYIQYTNNIAPISNFIDEYDKQYIEFLIMNIEKLVLYVLQDNLEETINKYFAILFKIMDVYEFDILYRGKHILNIIRQKNGYNTGNYNKIINEKEDNEILMELINEIQSNENEEEKIAMLLNIEELITKKIIHN